MGEPKASMAEQGWWVAQGVIGYAIVWPWSWTFFGNSGPVPSNPWVYAGVIFCFGTVCTIVRKLTDK